jgi:hypothetical protein
MGSIFLVSVFFIGCFADYYLMRCFSYCAPSSGGIWN